MDWDKIRIFHAVAEAGSFTRAGENLGLSQSAVSRQISALEEDFKVPLFHRHARGLILTEQGETLFRTAREMVGKLAITEAHIRDSKEQPSGALTVTAPVGLGSTWLTPRMKDFIEAYPQVSIDLVLSDRELDLGMREADIALRLRAPVQQDLVQRKLFTVHHHLYASPHYLRRHGTPQVSRELDSHKIITYGRHTDLPNREPVNWLEKLGRDPSDPRKAILSVNSIYGVLQAVESGLGIGALPDYLVEKNNAIMRILPNFDGLTYDTYFVYPTELRNSKRIIVFRDFLIREISETEF